MKHVLLFALFLFSFTVIHAQRLSNGAQLDTMSQITYINVRCGGWVSMRNDNIRYTVDCGIDSKEYRNLFLIDEEKKPLEFKSYVALVNYFAGQGWELVTASTLEEINFSYHLWLKRGKK